jgi:hypothetical protein
VTDRNEKKENNKMSEKHSQVVSPFENLLFPVICWMLMIKEKVLLANGLRALRSCTGKVRLGLFKFSRKKQKID